MNRKNKSAITRLGKIYILGIALVCGFLLTSADDCESMYFAEELRAREQAMKEEQERSSKAEQERIAAANRGKSQISQSQPAGGAQQKTQSGQTGTDQKTQTASGTATAQGTQSTTGGTSASSGAQTTANSGTSTSTSTQSAAAGTVDPSPGAASGSSGANYVTSISGKTWKLTELHFSDKTVVLNRNELSSSDADIFTMTIDGERIGGKGAPNRYFTAYQAGANNALTIQPIASTMMASIITEPQRIREQDYFQYLGKVKNWKINQNKLELTSTDKNNKALVMVYSN